MDRPRLVAAYLHWPRLVTKNKIERCCLLEINDDLLANCWLNVSFLEVFDHSWTIRGWQAILRAFTGWILLLWKVKSNCGKNWHVDCKYPGDFHIFKQLCLLYHWRSQTGCRFLVWRLADMILERRGVLYKEAGFSYDCGTSETSFSVVALGLTWYSLLWVVNSWNSWKNFFLYLKYLTTNKIYCQAQVRSPSPKSQSQDQKDLGWH